jgi:hypothetical protein
MDDALEINVAGNEGIVLVPGDAPSVNCPHMRVGEAPSQSDQGVRPGTMVRIDKINDSSPGKSSKRFVDGRCFASDFSRIQPLIGMDKGIITLIFPRDLERVIRGEIVNDHDFYLILRILEMEQSVECGGNHTLFIMTRDEYGHVRQG